MDKINDNLVISDAPSVRKLDDNHDFDLVVTLGYFDRLGYGLPSVSTTGDEYVFPDSPLHEYGDFANAAAFVEKRLEAGDYLLVHCQAGASRSPAVCAAVLAARQGCSYDEAIEDIQSKRDGANPQPSLAESAERYVESRKSEKHD